CIRGHLINTILLPTGVPVLTKNMIRMYTRQGFHFTTAPGVGCLMLQPCHITQANIKIAAVPTVIINLLVMLT
ncbi:hypothetical protein, partial [Salmonella enterica]|uniref:hypothetical protein n=1 Tax=Salmonella enterica TaxID=28901 RepID=UPI003298D4F6